MKSQVQNSGYVARQYCSQLARVVILVLAALASVILAGCAHVAATTVSLAPPGSSYPVAPQATTPATAGEYGDFCAVLNRYLWAPVSAAEEVAVAVAYNDETARELASASPPGEVAEDWEYLAPWFAGYVRAANEAIARPDDALLERAWLAQHETIETASYRQHFDGLGAWAALNCQ